MFRIRTFQNSDPPHLAEIWRSQKSQRGMVQPLSVSLLEHCVFGKNYFDPEGLLIAEEDGKPIGFAHAGFGPDDYGMKLDFDFGTTFQIRVHADHASQEIEDALLKGCESYLRSRGTKVLYGGGLRPLNAFYLGLYGGSELPGILDSDPDQQAIYARNGYRSIDRIPVLHCNLSSFNPAISRKQRDCLRNHFVEVIPDPQARTWWEANTYGCFDRLSYRIVNRKTGTVGAECRMWYMETFSTSWGLKTVGMDYLVSHPDFRRTGMASSLLSQAFCDLRQDGVTLVETQTMTNNAPALELYQKLGFVEIDCGSVYRKDGATSSDT